MTVSQTRENLAEVIGRVQYTGTRMEITKHGKIVAAIVSAEELAILKDYEKAEDRVLGDMVREVYADPDYDPEDTVSHEELWAQLLPDEPEQVAEPHRASDAA
jgi:prevent-host-death family protein